MFELYFEPDLEAIWVFRIGLSDTHISFFKLAIVDKVDIKNVEKFLKSYFENVK